MAQTKPMKITDLPTCDNTSGIFAFAMSYNGYEEYGSFEACAAAALERPRSTLDELRNELFFQCRAGRHMNSEYFVEIYKELLPHFERILGESEDQNDG